MNFEIGSDAAGCLHGVLDFFAALKQVSRNIRMNGHAQIRGHHLKIFDLKYVTGAGWGAANLFRIRIRRINWGVRR